MAEPEEVGLLLVHGIGEQKQLEHLRCTAAEIASYVAETAKLHRLSVADRSAEEGLIVIEAEFEDGGIDKHVRLNCREVWWADLGASGGLGAQVLFWLWGLGQWAAEIAAEGKQLSNTSQLMDNPHFVGDKAGEPPGIHRRFLTRTVLFGAGVLALLTLVTWSLVKRIVTFVAGKIPDTSLIFLFLGDVKAYQQPGGPGRGTQEDPNMPRRATIRRRMVSQMVDMGSHGYRRWYILAHSLGSVLAFNGLQETELALPNYLDEGQWDNLSEDFKKPPFTPPGTHPSTMAMMPRRPPWLRDQDGISRAVLFEHFRGLVTYGSPLDKFAALWPRMVCLNKQKDVFGPKCEWLNLYDPTDPVGASLGAFGSEGAGKEPETSLVPRNFGCRSSKAFLLSHVRYLTPRGRRKHPMAEALVDALLRSDSLVAAASKAANSKTRNGLRLLLAVLQVLGLFAILAIGAAALIVLGKDILFGSYPACAGSWRSTACVKTIGCMTIDVLGAAVGAVLVAGLLRMVYDVWFKGK